MVKMINHTFKMTVLQFISLIFLSIINLCSAASLGNTLYPGESLNSQQTLVSKQNVFQLGFISEDDSRIINSTLWVSSKVYYLAISFVNSPGTVIWKANRDNPINQAEFSLELSSRGNLVLNQTNLALNQTNQVIWSSGEKASNPDSTVLVLLDNGNLVIRDSENTSRITWQSFDHPTDAWLPGAPLGSDKVSGMNISLSFGDTLFEIDSSRTNGFIIKKNYGIINYSEGITRNFSNKLGEGGFGSVFKGYLKNLAIVAVKRLKHNSSDEKQFRTEVRTIGMIHHNNLVKLLGFCSKGAQQMLVYECMPFGSLDTYLFSNGRYVINWKTRYQIMLGIAKGLTYLHQECLECIIHCDIKPENILLDEKFCPKIADFGMAKLLSRDCSRVLTTTRGTIGYLAPEWLSGQPITQKADVYSFGLMLFEIISGRRNRERIRVEEYTYFPIYAAVKINQGELLCLLDDKLEGVVNMDELDRACKVACWCIQDWEMERPSMEQVVHMLEGIVNIDMPPVPRELLYLSYIENNSSYYTFG
ncbi:hypothetical protein LUZ61_004801 [Rhynchospora tenuis]|uniref:non-specific serine/threonine protein kinase n=1 Tax=Rhynchospora tenuis TaxID=198213 RepID=A0AAD6EU11_9POAL|nr:hypothetical protein LUZ61_004801 [Rhynchospora tenuis]